jgi:hypothetical protein
MSLALRTLPSLLTDCVLVGHEKRADVVWTPRQWFAMCIHMLNENVANFFLKLYRDENGQPKFSKAFKHDVTKWIEWSWRSITGKAEALVAIGFYPTNAERKSRWAAMDFDAHDGNTARARDFALKAFAFLYQQPQLYVVLATSAGDLQRTGYHLFVFSREFYPCEDWTLLLKQVAAQIGAPIEDGICEIFPNEFRGIGKALRAPGTWNPKTGDCGLILHQTLTQCVTALPSGEDKESIALYLLGEPRGKNYPSSPSSEFSGVSTANGQPFSQSARRVHDVKNCSNWLARRSFRQANRWHEKTRSFSTAKLPRLRRQYSRNTSLNLRRPGRAWSENG